MRRARLTQRWNRPVLGRDCNFIFYQDLEMNKTQESRGVFRRAIISGTIGGLATATAASLAGKCEQDSYSAPLNATSHILWGDKAARANSPSLKYTLTGFLLNHASAIFWALFYEKLTGWRGASNGRGTGPAKPAKPVPLAKPIAGAAAVTAGAYITDYYLVPKRFTPGFEKRLSGKSLAIVFAALAAGLAARDLIAAAKTRRK